MFVDYKSISNDAKVWVYPSSRKFYPTEIPEIEQKLKEFVENWKLEDENFKVSYQFLYDRFIILVADDSETALTNADIDASVAWLF